MVQIWNQHNTPEIDLDEMEISDLPEKEFKIIVKKKLIMVIKMLTEVWKTMCEKSDNLNK